MNWILEDRRQRRSRETQQALRYQLEHSRDRGALQAIVVADALGISLATAGDRALAEELAAIAPVLVRAPLGLSLPSLLRGHEVAVRPIEVDGQELFVATVGGGMARDALLTVAVRGVTRILASN